MLIFKLFQFVTLIAMWVIPLGLCAQNLWWRFIFVWLVFSCITGLIVRKALQHPIRCTTPRLELINFLFSQKKFFFSLKDIFLCMKEIFYGFNHSFCWFKEIFFLLNLSISLRSSRIFPIPILPKILFVRTHVHTK